MISEIEADTFVLFQGRAFVRGDDDELRRTAKELVSKRKKQVRGAKMHGEAADNRGKGAVRGEAVPDHIFEGEGKAGLFKMLLVGFSSKGITGQRQRIAEVTDNHTHFPGAAAEIQGPAVVYLGFILMKQGPDLWEMRILVFPAVPAVIGFYSQFAILIPQGFHRSSALILAVGAGCSGAGFLFLFQFGIFAVIFLHLATALEGHVPVGALLKIFDEGVGLHT